MMGAIYTNAKSETLMSSTITVLASRARQNPWPSDVPHLNTYTEMNSACVDAYGILLRPNSDGKLWVPSRSRTVTGGPLLRRSGHCI
jgi:hypothetical protein